MVASRRRMGGQSKAWTSFNPLHCGAVVASRNSVSCSGVRSICFNPLHCGAVVASRWRRAGRRRSAQVSIPFIAGQWSLRGDAQSRCVRRARVSIPFIAGQWSLQAELAAAALLLRIGFNPLHCGAVVASFWLSLHSLDRIHVSIPFIAGQWSLRVVIMAMTDGEARFQSPSLRGSGRFRAPARTSARPVSSFNPLHCGAVVASGLRLSIGGVACGCFNPLHCGAVVASPIMVAGDSFVLSVSIPFIAGQWSLPAS